MNAANSSGISYVLVSVKIDIQFFFFFGKSQENEKGEGKERVKQHTEKMIATLLALARMRW